MYERNYDLISKKFREFFLPTLFTSMAGNICFVIDSMMVAFLIGEFNLSVMQLVSPVTTFVNLIYWMIGLGGSVLCSVSKAEFDERKSNSYFTVSVFSLLIIGVILSVGGLVFSNQIVHFLCRSENLLTLVSQFFNAYIIGLPFLCYIMCLSYFVRADGLPKMAFRAILLSNIVNICCDVIFISVLNLGISGAAYATVVGYIVGSIYISTYFFKSERTLRLINLKLNRFLTYLKKICKSGFSGASTQLYFTFKAFIYNTLITIFIGEAGLVAFGICDNSLFILYMFLIGAAQTMSPIVSVYFKEEDYEGVQFIVKKALKIALTSSLIFAILIIIYPDMLLTLYSVKNQSFIPVVFNAVRIFALSYVGTAITFLYTFYAEAIQKDLLASIISLLEGLIVPCASAFILAYLIGGNGIWISFTIAEVVTILFILMYSKYINKKSNGEFSGFFINKHNDDKDVFEYTIQGNVKDAVELSAKVQKYLKDYKVATQVSLVIEEIIVNIIKLNDHVDLIDVIVKIQEDYILVSVKDSGVEYNPIVEQDELNFDNISVLNKIADKIDYSRVLGLNSTVITIKK